MLLLEAWAKEADEREFSEMKRRWQRGEIDLSEFLPVLRRMSSPPAGDRRFWVDHFALRVEESRRRDEAVAQVPWLYKVFWDYHLQWIDLSALPRSFVDACPDEYAPQLETSYTYQIDRRDADNYKDTVEEGSIGVDGEVGGPRPPQTPRQILQELERAQSSMHDPWWLLETPSRPEATAITHTYLLLEFEPEEFGDDAEDEETRTYYVEGEKNGTWTRALARWLGI